MRGRYLAPDLDANGDYIDLDPESGDVNFIDASDLYDREPYE
jgi:hypothetical protein